MQPTAISESIGVGLGKTVNGFCNVYSMWGDMSLKIGWKVSYYYEINVQILIKNL